MNGRRHHLGPHGTKASKCEYDRLTAEWLANGRQSLKTAGDGLSIAELMVRYLGHVRKHYVKNDRPTGEQAAILYALKPLRAMYSTTSAADFGPLRLEVLRERMIGLELSRGTINRHVSRVRRTFVGPQFVAVGPPDRSLLPAVVQGQEPVLI